MQTKNHINAKMKESLERKAMNNERRVFVQQQAYTKKERMKGTNEHDDERGYV